jgi:hypothetical protein
MLFREIIVVHFETKDTLNTLYGRDKTCRAFGYICDRYDFQSMVNSLKYFTFFSLDGTDKITA